MAKTKLGSGEFNLDNSLDEPSFDFDFGEPKDDRTPVEQILAGVKKGTTSAFRNTGFIKTLMRASLPPAYGEAEDVYNLTSNNASQLYNKVTKEIKPSISQLIKSSEGLVPDKHKRTKKTLQAIKEWADEFKSRSLSDSDKEAIRDKNIELNVADVFANIAQNQNDQFTEEKARDAVKESLGLIKHKQSIGILEDVRHHISRLSQYNEKVTQAFQKKTLELQYRSYFAQADLVEQNVRLFELSKTSYSSIIKNTALPEYVKLRDSERFKELAKTKMIESLFGTTSSFINKSFKNIGVKVNGYVDTFKDALGAATMGADVASMSKEMVNDPSTSLREQLAKGGVESAVKYGAVKLGGKLNDYIGRNKKLKDIADNARHTTSNIPEILTEYANGYSYDDSSWKGASRSVLKDLIGNQGPDASIVNDSSNGASDLGLFSRQTNKSIIEIIPGYLARILREIQVFRTGNEQTELTVYDPYTNKFKDKSSLKSSILAKLVPEGSIRSHEESKKDIFELVDPDGKLTPDQRNAIMENMTKDRFNRKGITPKSLMSTRSYSKDDRLKDSADDIAKVFQDYFNNNGTLTKSDQGYLDRRNSLSKRTNQIGRFFNNPASEIQNLINMGQYDELRELGLINENGSSVDMEEVLRRHTTTGRTVGDSPMVEPSLARQISNSVSNVSQTPFNTASLESTVNRLSDKLMDQSDILKDFINSNSGNQDQFRLFIEDNVKTLTTNIGDYSSKTEVAKTNEILARIEDFLLTKLHQIIGMSSSRGSEPSAFHNEQFDPESEGYYKNNIWNNLRGLSDKTIGPIYRNIAKPINKGIFKLIGASGRATKKSFGMALNAVTGSTNFLANLTSKAKDIFVDGEIEPRLKATGLKAGHYIDSVTGKVIETLGDLKKIKGDIKDKDGNIVLYLSEVKKTFVKRIEGSGIFRLGGWIGEKALNFSKFTSGQFFKGLGLIGKTFELGKKTFSFLLDSPVDIYLKGTTTPIMLAIIMRNGGYISVKTKKPVLKPSDIDGPIVDSEGNYVLTAEQLKQGIVDKFGKTISTPLMKLIGFGASIIRTGLNAAKGISKLGLDIVKGGLNKTGDLFKGILDTISVGIGGKESHNVLVDIRDILDSRLPGDKKLFGDTDGDGDRENSWKDIFSRKKNKDKETKETKDSTVKPDRQNTFDRIAEAAGGIKDKILGALGLGDDEDGIDVDIDLDGNPSKGKRRRGRGAKKGGLLRKSGRVLGNVAKGALGVGGWLGRGLLTAGAAALPAVGSALGATAGAIATAVPAILAGAGALISSPIFLTVAGLAAVGYGGYKAYKYLTKQSNTNLVKMRMAQYGLSIDEQDHYGKISELESKVLSKVKYDDNNANFDIPDILVPEMLRVFGIDPEDNSRKTQILIERWMTWFTKRFKPVYLVHLTALKKLGSNQSLSSVDSLDGEAKVKYINATLYPEGPYRLFVSPLPELDQLEVDGALVSYYGDEALKEAKAESDKDKKEPKEKKAIMAAAAITATATTTVSPGDKNVNTTNNALKNSTFVDKLKSSLSVLKTPMLLLGPFAALAAISAKVIGQPLLEKFGFGLTALEAVRMKTYGIRELTRSKISSVRGLESVVIDSITFDSDGRAYYDEPISNLLEKIGSDFSISDPNSPSAKNFLLWFQQRFLPVYLNYVSLVRQALGGNKASKDEAGLKDSDKLDIAKKLAATTGVWSVSVSPWENETSNTDESITKENIQYLTDKAKDAALLEEKSGAGTKPNASVPSTTSVIPNRNDNVKTTVDKVTKTDTTLKSDPGESGVWDRINTSDKDSAKPDTYADKYDVKVNEDKNRKKSSKGFSGFGDDVDGHISEASKKYNIDEKVLRGFVKMEAGWKGAMSPTGAIGVGQFTQGTWDALAKTPEGKEIGMTKIGSRFRTAEDPRHDKRLNTLATALLAKQNADQLTKNGLDVNGENLYMMHNIGPGFMKAVKTGDASPATLKAMQLNGMKPGMTPASFVEYQKSRFNSHYETANGSSEGIVTADYKKPSDKVPQTASKPRDVLDGFKSNATTIASTQSNGYMGSVEKTKVNPSIATPPAYTQRELPRGDGIETLMRKNRESAARADRPTNIDPNIVISGQLNSAVGGLKDIANQQLIVQSDMLSVLREISGKVGNVSQAQRPETKKELPETQKSDGFQTTKAQKPRDTSQLPKAPVVLSRS